MSTLVIGAGMAGLKAARDLHAAGETVTVLEARDRIGGRVYTRRDFFTPTPNTPVEFGAEFIHGADAPTWLLAHELGLPLLHWKKQDDSLVRLADGSLKNMSDARAQHPDFDVTRSWALDFAPVHDGDESLAAYLRRIGFTEDQIQYTRRSFANAACEAPENISATAAIEEMTDTTAGEGDFRILPGYDLLIEYVAQALDIHLNTVVKRIDWSGSDVRVEASNPQGDVVYRADQVVITLPLGVLQSGKVIFSPALPDDKQNAINHLIMGVGLKLLYVFDQKVLPDGVGAFYSAHNPPMWWSPTFTREVTGEAITALATGDWARELIAMGDEAALQKGLESLRDELGRPDLTPVATHFMNWAADEFALGAYSVAPVGGSTLRLQIATPVGDKLFWAGEHTAKNAWAATVHGAYASGQRAAQEILNR